MSSIPRFDLTCAPPETYERGFTRRIDPTTGKETLWYTAFFAALSYAAVRAAMEGSFSFLDASRLTVELVELDKNKNKEYVYSACELPGCR